ncbi:hypothetical protein GYMLUDRAFT_55922 [Collybiopsis luxurians FD-317 M1]|nr:hypothetical protein GYMLUDRAFT_55922 [Collybiopsis luxurians FD-317 M1]
MVLFGFGSCPLKACTILVLGFSLTFGKPVFAPTSASRNHAPDEAKSLLLPRAADDASNSKAQNTPSIEPTIRFTSPNPIKDKTTANRVRGMIDDMMRKLQSVAQSDKITHLQFNNAAAEEDRGELAPHLGKVFKFKVSLPATWPKGRTSWKDRFKSSIIYTGTVTVPVDPVHRSTLMWNDYFASLVDESKGMLIFEVKHGEVGEKNVPLDPSKASGYYKEGKEPVRFDKNVQLIPPQSSDDESQHSDPHSGST